MAKNTLTQQDNRFKKANFKPITITMKKSGDKVIITPCSELGHIKNMNDISYFLIESQYVNLCGCDTLSELAQTIQNYEDIREQTLKEKHKCHEYYEHNIKGNPVEKLTQVYILKNRKSTSNLMINIYIPIRFRMGIFLQPRLPQTSSSVAGTFSVLKMYHKLYQNQTQ